MPFSNRGSSRRAFLQKAVAATAAVSGYPPLVVGREVTSQPTAAPQVRPFELDEITIGELQDGMKSGRFTARLLVEKYSERIDEIDKSGPRVNAIIEMNPDALAIAEALDRARKASLPPWDGLSELAAEVGVSELADVAEIAAVAGQDGARILDTLNARAESMRAQALASAKAQAGARSTTMVRKAQPCTQIRWRWLCITC